MKCCLGLRSYVLKRLEVLFSWRYYNDLCYLNVEGHAKFISSSIAKIWTKNAIFGFLFFLNFESFEIFEFWSLGTQENIWNIFFWKIEFLYLVSFDKKWISSVDPAIDVWVDTPPWTPWVQWRVQTEIMLKQNFSGDSIKYTGVAKTAVAEIGHVTYMDMFRMPNWHIIYERNKCQSVWNGPFCHYRLVRDQTDARIPKWQIFGNELAENAKMAQFERGKPNWAIFCNLSISIHVTYLCHSYFRPIWLPLCIVYMDQSIFGLIDVKVSQKLNWMQYCETHDESVFSKKLKNNLSWIIVCSFNLKVPEVH